MTEQILICGNYGYYSKELLGCFLHTDFSVVPEAREEINSDKEACDEHENMGVVEKSEDESLCDDCEWFKNPGECPDYDESKCKYNAPMEKEE